MPLYNYKALNTEGETYEKTLLVSDKAALYAAVKEEGGKIISVSEKKKSKFSYDAFSRMLTGVKEHEKIVFAKNLASMMSAGLSVSRALSVMERQNKNPKLKEILGMLRDDIAKGQTLSLAMKKFPKVFSDLFVSMVGAGEESGSLSDSLNVISVQMEKAYTLKKKVRGALMYPAIILVVMIIIAILMLLFIVPTLSSTFGELGVELPLSTRIIIGTSNFIKENTLLSLSFGIFALLAAFFAGRTSRGKRFLDWVFLHIPIIGSIVKEVNAARTARTLSSLLSSGVDVVVALSITGDVIQNSYYKLIIKEAEKQVQLGENISTVVARYENLYPAFVTEMVSVGEETGKLGEMLMNVALFYEENVDQKTKDMSTIIEPFLMVFMGIGVGFFALSMLSPIYSLVDVI